MEAIVKFAKKYKQSQKKNLANSEDLFEAMRNYARIVNSMPHQMSSILKILLHGMESKLTHQFSSEVIKCMMT